MWKITKQSEAMDKSCEELGMRTRVGMESPDYVEGTELPYEFRMRYEAEGPHDDLEKLVEFWGVSSEADSFAPLDDLGTPDVGCTIIEYKHPATGAWEVL